MYVDSKVGISLFACVSSFNLSEFGEDFRRLLVCNYGNTSGAVVQQWAN
jgi:hypothetical protein